MPFTRQILKIVQSSIQTLRHITDLLQQHRATRFIADTIETEKQPA
ncbi:MULTISPECIES: hypothetical protein [unclassified Saccharibacter]|nr:MULTISPECIES: hypothetical protein [unclassified Saccharibacter]MXV57456.1 hypothetical protein [Saccharibacter sp. EH70]MXV64683.1 hypothetical protein [Saccharibacter sp. EH60]